MAREPSLRAPLAPVGLLVGAAAVVYCNSFAGAFQFDDRSVILDDARLDGWPAFFAGAPGMIRPLLKLTFLVDRTLFGNQPAGYHGLNLLLHAASVLLVYAIVGAAVRARAARALPDAGGGGAAVFDAVPFAAALLFAVHPLATETVTYISGRASGLSACLCLLSLYLFCQARLTPRPAAEPGLTPRLTGEATPEPSSADGGPRRDSGVATGACPGSEKNRGDRLLAGAVVSFVSALLSKETAVVLPVLLVLWEALFSGGGADDRRNVVRRHLPFWIVLGVAAAGAWFHPRYALLARESFATRTVSDNLLTEANAAVYALTLFVFPWRLNFDHDLRPVHAITQWPTPLSLAVLAAIVAVAWWTRRRAPRVSLGLGWFLICLLPAHSLLPRYDIVSERNLYLPSVGIYLAVVAAVVAVAGHLGNRRARAAAALTPLLARPYGISRVRTFALAAVLGAIALGLATATVSRNRVYASEVAFWSDAAAKSPHKSRPHNNLGVALLEAGDVDRALDEFRTALALDPHNVTAQDNLRRAWGIRRSR